MLQQSDDRNRAKMDQFDFDGSRSNSGPWDEGMLWSMSRMGLGGGDGYFGRDFQQSNRFENDVLDVCGGSQQRKLIGISRDSVGATLGSVAIKAFLTAGNIFAGSVTSDTGGYFECSTPYAGQAHYIVAYKAGSPDVEGSTLNTLIPV